MEKFRFFMFVLVVCFYDAVGSYTCTLSINNGGGKRLTVLHDSFFSLLPFQSKPDDFDRAGMIKQFYSSNITGNRQGRRISLMSSCGTRLGIRNTETITTTTGLFTFLRPLLFYFLETFPYLYFACKPG
ncbi:uncharacterized protein LOC114190326 isoform X2 [Vigna unguiculata]|uniref:uncharacterized protein LOC114190326 isoform X2 n=1 Tax=Vigna unguiculata TaxID=3917 RepID=UPI0010167511|nr:uncharacterized protein LOC114190326 isoform X2 [Vigna unguiculata]